MFNKIITFFEKEIFIHKLKKLGEREYFKKYCGINDLKSEDCKHENKRVAKILTNKGDIALSYCTNCGAVLAVEALFNDINFEFAKAIKKDYKRIPKPVESTKSLNEPTQDTSLEELNKGK